MRIFARTSKKRSTIHPRIQLQCHPYVRKQENVIFKFEFKFYL